MATGPLRLWHGWADWAAYIEVGADVVTVLGDAGSACFRPSPTRLNSTNDLDLDFARAYCRRSFSSFGLNTVEGRFHAFAIP